MGISNLFKTIDKACRPGNIAEFAGQSIAVDVSCLLHRSLTACMHLIATGQDTTFYITYVEKRIGALLGMGCHVILVFDGRPLPSKKDTNDERRQKRAENLAAAEALLADGKASEAHAMFRRTTAINSDIVEKTIEAFRGRDGVDVLVSPYEADAQLAFLTQAGLADVVITEDSDLVVFGCEKILFKTVFESGACVVYERARLPACLPRPLCDRFDFATFRRICILSGCDYLQAGLPGVGLNKAIQFFSKTEQTDLRKCLPRVPHYLKLKVKVSKEFIEDFIRAENTFLYQIVFDPRGRCQRPLNPYPVEDEVVDDDDDDFVKKKESGYAYAGEAVSAPLAVRLALGNRAEGKSSATDKFLPMQKKGDWSVWGDSFVRGGERREKTKAQEHRQKTQCGAFMMPSPSKSRRRKAALLSDSDDDIEVVSEKVEKKEETVKVKRAGIKAFLSSQSSQSSQGSLPALSQRKKVRNEADQSWSVDQVLKEYAADIAADNGKEKEEEKKAPKRKRRCLMIDSEEEEGEEEEKPKKVERMEHIEEREKPIEKEEQTKEKPKEQEIVMLDDDDEEEEEKREKEEKEQKRVLAPVNKTNNEVVVECKEKPLAAKATSKLNQLKSSPGKFVSPLRSLSEGAGVVGGGGGAGGEKTPMRCGYLTKRLSGSCSNPFRKPVIQSPSERGGESPAGKGSPGAALYNMMQVNGVDLKKLGSAEKKFEKEEDEDGEEKPTGFTAFAFSPLARVGCRPAGLRRSVSSKK